MSIVSPFILFYSSNEISIIEIPHCFHFLMGRDGELFLLKIVNLP